MKKLIFKIAFVTITIDLVTKYLAQIFLKEKTIKLIGDYFSLDLVYNDGIAFGINIFPPLLLKIFTITLISYGIFYIFNKKEFHKLETWSFGLILGGAIGNAIERVLYSQVTDMFAIKYFSVFNIADVAITLGACMYLYFAFFISDNT